MEGLLQRLHCNDFVSFLKSFDIFCLTETYVDFKFQSDKMSEYCFLSSFAKKLTRRGRKSGGVIVGYRSVLKPWISEIDLDCDNLICLRLDKSIIGTLKDVFYIGTYVPPSNSDAYNLLQSGFGIEPLESCITTLYERYEDFHLFICGDLNARTASQNGLLDVDIDPIT